MNYKILKITIFILLTLAVFAYFVYKPHTAEGYRLSVKTQAKVMRVISATLIVFALVGFKDFLTDAANYYKQWHQLY